MNVFTRGIKNAFRNGVRTFSIVIILGLSIGLALSMMIARSAVEQKIASVKSSVGNTISVNPAGSQGFEGGGDALTLAQANDVKAVANVTNVTATLGDRLTTSDTNLQSAVDAGSLGRRFSNNNGTQFQPPAGGQEGSSGFSSNSSSSGTTRTFTPPIRVTGVNDLSLASVYGGSSITYKSGAAFDPTKDEAVAVIGSGLATKNNLSVGSTFTAYNTTIRVVGIYDTGTQFANNNVIMPLVTLQRLSNQANAVTAMTITVNSVDNLNSTLDAIKTKLGSAADVTSNQDTASSAVAPLENVKTISMYSFIAALIAGAVIILLTMVMIVRERRREIGVMKAIGSSNVKTMIQFMTESLTLTVVGLVIGLGIAVTASAPIANALVQTSTSSSQASATPGQGGPGRGIGRVPSIAGLGFQTIETSVGWSTLGQGAVAALVIALVGSAVPAYFISRIRPSEVMRAE